MPLRYTIEIEGRMAVVGSRELVIGRSLSCGLAIDNGSVSRIHASVRMVGEACEIADLGSSNGTYVNGRRLRGTPVAITPADSVRLGRAVLRVMVSQADAVEATWNRSLEEPQDEDPTDVFALTGQDDDY